MEKVEAEVYQRNLERLTRAFPDKELLNQKDVATFCGISEKTVGKQFPFRNHRISVATLADFLSR